MNRIWYNAEGYYDPTAGQALTNILVEEERRKKNMLREQAETKSANEKKRKERSNETVERT